MPPDHAERVDSAALLSCCLNAMEPMAGSECYRMKPETSCHLRQRCFIAMDAYAAARTKRLEAALLRCAVTITELVKNAPTEEPEWYDGDNHGDTRDNAFARADYHLALTLRPLQGEIDAALGEGE